MPLITDDEFLAGVEIEIDPLAMQRFLSYCELKTLAKKSVIIRGGEPADKLYYLIKGSVTVTTLDDEGHEVVLAYLNDGSFIGEIGLFYRTRNRIATVRSRTECEIAEIRYERLNTLFATSLKSEHAQILSVVGLQLCQRILKTTGRLTRLAFTDVAGRIARTLLDMCNEPEAMSHPDGTQIHISRQELGRIVGCSREMVGRVLKQMEIDGMVSISGMNIVIYHSR